MPKRRRRSETNFSSSKTPTCNSKMRTSSRATRLTNLSDSPTSIKTCCLKTKWMTWIKCKNRNNPLTKNSKTTARGETVPIKTNKVSSLTQEDNKMSATHCSPPTIHSAKQINSRIATSRAPTKCLRKMDMPLRIIILGIEIRSEAVNTLTRATTSTKLSLQILRKLVQVLCRKRQMATAITRTVIFLVPSRRDK